MFKPPQSDQKVKDKGIILEYIAAVKDIDGVTWMPSGVAQVTANPWSDDLGKGKGRGAIQVCSICNGCETDHSICIRNYNMAKHGMETKIEI